MGSKVLLMRGKVMGSKVLDMSPSIAFQQGHSLISVRKMNQHHPISRSRTKVYIETGNHCKAHSI